jgi:hypothetical protein
LLIPRRIAAKDAVAELGDGAGGFEEWGQAGSAGEGYPLVDQFGDLFDGQVAGEDGAEGFFQRVGAPYVAAAAFEPAQGGGLVLGEVGGVLQQRPAGAFERASWFGVAGPAKLVPRLETKTVWHRKGI